jgi:hypothetical protein
MFLGAFIICRVLTLAETGIGRVHLGVAFVEALIIAKVVVRDGLPGLQRLAWICFSEPSVEAAALAAVADGVLSQDLRATEHLCFD